MAKVNESGSLFLTFSGTGGGGGGGGSSVLVIDNLLSNSSSSALSANQGKILNESILSHVDKVASVSDLGHVKVDGVSITIDSEGVISASSPTIDIVDGTLTEKGIVQLSNDITEDETLAATPKAVYDALTQAKEYTDNIINGFEGSLRKEELVFENLTEGDTQITFTPKIVAIPFIELVFENTTKLKPTEYNLVDNGDDSFTVNFNEPFKDTDMINITLISGLADGAEGKPLTKEAFRFDNLVTSEQQGVTIPFTPANGDSFVDLVYVNTTKLEESEYQINEVSNGQYELVINPTVTIGDDTMVNLVLFHGEGIGGGSGGSNIELSQVVDESTTKAVTPKAVKDYVESLESSLIKESFRFDNLVTANQQGISIKINPVKVSERFVDFVYLNTTKLEESEYQIVKANDNPLEYTLTIDNSKVITPSTMINVTLLDGEGFGGGSSSSVDLSQVVDDSTDKAVTPKAVKDYVESLESDLTKNAFELRPTVEGQTEFDMPSIYDPKKHIDLVFYNTIKLLESRYNIVEKATGDSSQGYKLVLQDAPANINSAIYNLVLISGKAIGGQGDGSGSVLTINGNSPDANGNIEVDTVEKYIYTGTEAPSNTSLFWNKV